MADVHCPMCGKPNSSESDVCQFCGARLKPVLASTPVDSQPIKAGEQPIKRDTSDFEKVKTGGGEAIHPGEAPIKRDTGELERALPSWLRTLREDGTPSEGGFPAEPTSDAGVPAAPSPDASGNLPDWLSGLGNAAAEEEEQVPDWLAGLRGDKAGTPAPEAKSTPGETPAASEADWLSRLGEPSADASSAAAVKDDADWMKHQQSRVVDGQPPENEPSPVGGNESGPSGDFPDWFKEFKDKPEPGVAASAPAADAADWLDKLTGKPASATAGSDQPLLDGDKAPASPGGSTGWLNQLTGNAPSETPASSFQPEGEPSADENVKLAPSEESPDWLNQFKGNVPQETVEPAGGSESVPDWLSGFGSAPGAPAPAAGESTPDWPSNLGTQPETAPEKPASAFNSLPPALSDETPDWLSKFQTDIKAAEDEEKKKDEFEVVSEPPPFEKKDDASLPGWLAGIEPDQSPSEGALSRNFFLAFPIAHA